MTASARPDGVLVDLDGTLFHGAAPLPGAIEFMEALKAKGIPFLYWTNNSTRSPEDVAEHLRHLGFKAQANETFTSSQALVALAGERLGVGATVHVIGENGLRTAVAEAGWRDVSTLSVADADAAGPVAAVLFGMDRQITYEKLNRALQCLLSGAWFMATNNDRVLPGEHTYGPGTGALLAALETAWGQPAEVAGKPSPRFVEAGSARLGISSARTLVIGDNLDTDIRGGRGAGAMTAWVRTGVPAPDGVLSELEPDLVVDDLRELLRLW